MTSHASEPRYCLRGVRTEPVRQGEDADRGVRNFAWAHDGRTLLYVQDRGGDENWRLYGVDLLAGGTRDLTPFDGVQAQLIGLDIQLEVRDPYGAPAPPRGKR